MQPVGRTQGLAGGRFRIPDILGEPADHLEEEILSYEVSLFIHAALRESLVGPSLTLKRSRARSTSGDEADWMQVTAGFRQCPRQTSMLHVS